MAHKKAGGSTSNLRDSQGQRLGVKLYSGEVARDGAIIVRQRGTRYMPGENTKRSKDDTIFATSNGIVSFKKKQRKGFDGKLRPRIEVNVTQKA